MGMYSTQYSQTSDSTLKNYGYHVYNVGNDITEMTEDIPGLAASNEQKRSFKEGGGNSYIKNGTLLQSSEFTILGQETINGKVTTISLKTYNGVPGLYRVSEDGTHVKLI